MLIVLLFLVEILLDCFLERRARARDAQLQRVPHGARDFDFYSDGRAFGHATLPLGGHNRLAWIEWPPDFGFLS